jgi:hypothetical protein
MFVRNTQEFGHNGLRQIEKPRPATGAGLNDPSQPTHRVLRFYIHRAFSYAVITVPQVLRKCKGFQEIFPDE